MITTGLLYTIGHGGRDQSGLLTQLAARRVGYLLDVRSRPYSRHAPQFCRDALTSACHSTGISYAWLGDQLGGLPDDPELLDETGRVDYAKLIESPGFVAGLDRLLAAHRAGHIAALLCSELDPARCHRSKAIGVEMKACGIDLIHLLPDGSEETQTEVERRIAGSQLSLFGTTSRRRL